jgi:hypothetical protein
MSPSGVLRPAALVRINISEELSASIIRMTRIGELGTTLALNSNRCTLRKNTKSSKRPFLQEPHGVTSQKTAFSCPHLPSDGMICVLWELWRFLAVVSQGPVFAFVPRRCAPSPACTYQSQSAVPLCYIPFGLSRRTRLKQWSRSQVFFNMTFAFRVQSNSVIHLLRIAFRQKLFCPPLSKQLL